MKILDVKMRENIRTMTIEYRVEFLGIFRWYPVFTHEELVTSLKKPIRLRLISWLWQKSCSHKWAKMGSPRMEGYFIGDKPVTMIQKIECENCKKESDYKYNWGVDTSF